MPLEMLPAAELLPLRLEKEVFREKDDFRLLLLCSFPWMAAAEADPVGIGGGSELGGAGTLLPSRVVGREDEEKTAPKVLDEKTEPVEAMVMALATAQMSY